MRIKGKQLILIIVVSAVVYLVAGAMAPFMKYKEVSSQAGDSFRPEDFRSTETGTDRAMILETSQSAWEHRLRLLDGAQSRIILSTFDMRNGESTKDLLAVILHKAEEGVQVQILVDGFSGLIRMEPDPLFYAVSSHPNIQIKIYNPINLLTPWKSQGRMHDKYVIVDDSAYILGGRNTFDYFLGDYDTKNKSLDREVLVYNTGRGGTNTRESVNIRESANTQESANTRDSSLFQVEEYFNGVWNMPECRLFHDDEGLRDKKRIKEQTVILEKRYEELQENYKELFDGSYDYLSHTFPTNRIRLVSGPTGIYGKEPDVFYTLAELMKRAEKRVVIHTPYVVTNDYMNQTLTEIVNAVPDVKMVINSVENGDNFVASSDYQYHKKDVVATGIRLYEYDGGYSTHGKSLVIDDDLCAIGSYNFDLRSTYMDTELMLVIQSEELTGQLLGYMGEIEKDCRIVVDTHNYIVPEHVVVEEVPFWKRAAWKVVGLLLQPVRVLA